MGEWAIVTGGGSGIGRELARQLARRGLDVLVAGRRLEPLQETRRADPGRIHVVSADVGDEEGRAALVDALPSAARVRCLVHNAGVLTPIGPLAEVSLHDWRSNQAINVEGPLFLTQALLGQLSGGRVLHVSSGAAHHGYRGWGAYCTAKAALHMLYQVLRDELRARDIAVGSIRPGVVDTPMQGLIRQQDEQRFPAVQRFIGLKQSGQLIAPTAVAEFMTWLLLDTDVAAYSAAEWDYTDPEQRARRPG